MRGRWAKFQQGQKAAGPLGLAVFASVLLLTKGVAAPYWWFSFAAFAASIAAARSIWAVEWSQLVVWCRRPQAFLGINIVPADILREVGVFLLFLALTVAILPDQAMGRRPVDHDHTVHFFKIWQFGQFVADGRIFGWSDQWFAGYPAQYLYPFGADIYVWAIRGLSLGLMSLDRAYAYGIFFFWFLRGYSLYWLGRHSVGRWAGLIAGIFFMGDTAAFRFGGWVFAMQWGVWPQSLSVVLAVLALAQLRRVLTGDDWKSVGLFGGFMGASLLVHPLQLVHFAILAVVCVLALATTPVTHRLRSVYRLGLAYTIGFSMSALWLLPFFSTSKYAVKYGKLWETTFTLGSQFYNGGFVPGTWPFVAMLGVVGVVGALLSRRLVPAIMALMVLTLLVTGSSTFLAEFHVPEILERVSFVQFLRFGVILKPYLFLLAGAVFVEAVGRASIDLDSWRPHQWAVRVFVVVALAAPLMFGFVEAVRTKQFARKLTPERSRVFRSARQDFLRWHQEIAPAHEGEFYRIGLAFGRLEHTMADLGVGQEVPFIKLGETPATLFRFKIGDLRRQALDATDVRYVLGVRVLKQKHFEFIKDFGPLKLYRYLGWKPARFDVLGEGEVEAVRFENEEIVLRAKAGARGRLRLHTAYFPRWKAYRDGEPIAIDVAKLKGIPLSGMMEVELAPGEYRFVFERAVPERLGEALFLLALLLFVIMVTQNPITRRLAALSDRIDRWEDAHEARIGVFIVAATAGGVLVAVLIANWVPGKTTYDFAENLGDAVVSHGSGEVFRPCHKALGQHICGNESYKRVEVRMGDYSQGWSRCIWAHPQKGQTLRLAWDDVPPGAKLKGFYGVMGNSNARRPVRFRIALDGVEVLSQQTRRDGTRYEFDLDLRQASDVAFLVDAKDVGARHFCFNASVE